ncbi:hypothetical protein SDC9_51622 [bioreactor metagenome]|uniref:Flavodoxin domain-containing protein n=1 Tax=bioreactor metagenome TaxID=1076179 RepID=A0A644WT52_9ZZZZ
MSTLIAYASKYGFTKNCAGLLVGKLTGQTDLFDLDSGIPDLSRYGTVIVGASVYAGKLRKAASRFCAQNAGQLKEKKLGLFVCGIAEGEMALKEIESVFPQELLAAAAAKGFFGGAFDFEKMNFFERFIMKRILGSSRSQTRILEDNIERFAQKMNQA